MDLKDDRYIKDVWIAQFVSLRTEIQNRLQAENQFLVQTLVVAGVFIAAGSQEGLRPSVFLAYPIVAAGLTMLWLHNELVLQIIGDYIKTHHDVEITGNGKTLCMWETYVRKTFPSMFLSPWGRRSAIATLSGTPLIAIALAFITRYYDLKITASYYDVTQLGRDFLVFVGLDLVLVVVLGVILWQTTGKRPLIQDSTKTPM